MDFLFITVGLFFFGLDIAFGKGHGPQVRGRPRCLRASLALNWPNHYYPGGVRERTLGELLLNVAAAPAQLGFYVARYVFPSYSITLRLACSMN